MSLICKCDSCGNTFPYNNNSGKILHYKITVEPSNFFSSKTFDIDLCSNCTRLGVFATLQIKGGDTDLKELKGVTKHEET